MPNNVTILKKINQNLNKNEELKVSFIIPCKNEEKNIKLFEKEITQSNKNEYLFGNDNSEDQSDFKSINFKKLIGIIL